MLDLQQVGEFSADLLCPVLAMGACEIGLCHWGR